MSVLLQKSLLVAALLVAASVVALIVEWRLELGDRRALISEDSMVPLADGTRLRTLRLGAEKSGPTVVFLAGLSGTVESWRFVQRDVARFSPTFAYDRAGAGFSDGAAGTRDARAVAAELDQVLRAAKIPPPYLLTAHSIAGLYARVYASEHPEKVAGLVLVDPLTEDEWSRVSPATSGADQDFLFDTTRRKALLGYLGLLRLRAHLGGTEVVDARLAAASWRGTHWRTAAREADAVFVSFDEARAAPFPPDAAVGILSAGLPRSDDIAIVQALHAQLAGTAKKGRLHEVDPDADHSELLDLPEHSLRVTAFIRKVLECAAPGAIADPVTAH